MRRHKFNVRLFFNKEELERRYSIEKWGQGGEWKITFPNKCVMMLHSEGETGEFYLDFKSDQLEKVDNRIMEIAIYVTAQIYLTDLKKTAKKPLDGTYLCCDEKGNRYETLSNVGCGRADYLYATGKDPFFLRQFVEDIIDRKILPVKDDQTESLTAKELADQLERAMIGIERFTEIADAAKIEIAEHEYRRQLAETRASALEEELRKAAVILGAMADERLEKDLEIERCRKELSVMDYIVRVIYGYVHSLEKRALFPIFRSTVCRRINSVFSEASSMRQ